VNAQPAAYVLDVEAGIDCLDLLKRPLHRRAEVLAVRIVAAELLGEHLPGDAAARPVLLRRDEGALRAPGV
jgi:hypothetical protein